MLRTKEGVRFDVLRWDLLKVLPKIEAVWADLAIGVDPVITSGTDGQHMAGSLHYVGLAVDLRTNNLTSGKAQEILTALKTAVGVDYDVVLERDHIHLEYDPKELKV